MSMVMFQWLVGVVAGLAVLAKPVQLAWRMSRRLSRFLDVWEGDGDKRPGIDDRLQVVEARTEQLVPNGGGSVKDAVVRIDDQLREHIADCRNRRWFS